MHNFNWSLFSSAAELSASWQHCPGSPGGFTAPNQHGVEPALIRHDAFFSYSVYLYIFCMALNIHTLLVYNTVLRILISLWPVAWAGSELLLAELGTKNVVLLLNTPIYDTLPLLFSIKYKIKYKIKYGVRPAIGLMYEDAVGQPRWRHLFVTPCLLVSIMFGKYQ